MTYPRDSANARSCLAKVRYLRSVAAAIFSPSRSDMNTAHASAMAIGPGVGNAGAAATTGGGNLKLPSHPPAASQAAATFFRFVPLEPFGVLAFERPGQRPAGIDRAVAFFPAAPQFIGFVAARIGLVTGGTFPGNTEVAAVEIEGHGADWILTPLPTIAHKFLNSMKLQLAVRVGFEPTEPAKVQRFSRPPDSTTLAPHRILILPGFHNLQPLSPHDFSAQWAVSPIWHHFLQSTQPPAFLHRGSCGRSASSQILTNGRAVPSPSLGPRHFW
jgi:hypothetical protein